MMMRARGLNYVMLFAVLALGQACGRTSGAPGGTGGAAYTPSGTGGLSAGDQAALAKPAAPTPSAPATPLYTACNLWYEKPDHLYSTGYHVGAIVPAGSPVTNVAIEKGRGRSNWIAFTCKGIPFRMEFMAQHHPGMAIQQYCDRLFTSKTLGELTDGFSSAEMDAVKSGMLKPGLSKKAVTVAYGYPPESLTPSLESNLWMYQDNRVRRKQVMFNEGGLTTSF